MYAILNKKDDSVISRGLNVFMVHYLFIHKQWNKDGCVITDENGTKMNYQAFSKIHHL